MKKIIPPFSNSYPRTCCTLERHRPTERLEVIASSYISVTWLRFSRQESRLGGFTGSMNAKSFPARETYFTKKKRFLVIWKDESWDINFVIYTFQFDLYYFDLYVVRLIAFTVTKTVTIRFFPQHHLLLASSKTMLRENENPKRKKNIQTWIPL